MGTAPFKREILSPFITKLIYEIEKGADGKGDISAENYKTIIRERIKADILQSKRYKERLNELLSVLSEKKKVYNSMKESVRDSWQQSSNRRLKALYYLIGAQMLFTQYGTYIKYSWDIMEPITCLFGVMDMILLYIYWYKWHDTYHNQGSFFKKEVQLDDLSGYASYEAFEKNWITKNLKKSLDGLNFELQDHKDLDKLISHLKMRKGMESHNLGEILDALDNKFQLQK